MDFMHDDAKHKLPTSALRGGGKKYKQWIQDTVSSIINTT